MTRGFPPYCIDCEALLTAADAEPLCNPCMQRMYDEAYEEVEPEIERAMLDRHYLKWGAFWTDTYYWMHPWEFLAWCLGTQDADPTP